MEEIPFTTHPMKLICLEGEKLTGCGVVEIRFSTAVKVRRLLKPGTSIQGNYSRSNEHGSFL